VTRSALVTGATGVLGPTLVRALVREGWQVRALCRRPAVAGLLPEAVEIRSGDVRDPDDVAAAVKGVSTVFHLAGFLHEPSPDPAQIPLYEDVNVGGTRHVARAAEAEGAAVVFFSSIAVYGPTPGGPVDEAAPVQPVGPYAVSKRRGEEALLDSGLPVTVLRLAAAYGRRMKGNYRRLSDALRRRRFVPVGDGSNRRTLVHEEDAVRAALLAADRVRQQAGLYNVTDGTTHSIREILGAMCRALGRPEPSFQIPVPIARMAARSLGYGEVLAKYLENIEVRGERIRSALGFEPRFGLEAGWRGALADPEEPL
jgi:nucleoside-diphosphate-sugar epimerase